MLRSLFVALALLSSPAFAKDRPEAAWLEWRSETEKEFAEARLAILKAADVLYLEAGDTAHLAPRADGSLDLSLKSSRKDLLQIAYDGKAARLKRGELTFDYGSYIGDVERYPVSDRYDLGGGPTQIEPGKDGFRVMLFDQERVEAKDFAGASWFPFNRDLVKKAKFRPSPAMEEKTIQTERGLWRRYFLAGSVHIETDEGAFDLPLYASSNEPEKIKGLFVSFTDKTTGEETYGVGRYLDFTEFGAFPPKKLTVDFNRAYNPYCARSPHYNCPKAMTSIPIKLTAGEKSPEH